MVRMLTTIRGSPDGLRSYMYEEGRDYSRTSNPPLSADLEQVFLREGWAERVSDQQSAERKVVNPTQATDASADQSVDEPAQEQATAEEAEVQAEQAVEESAVPQEADASDVALEQYKVPGGWYQLPGVDRKVRKAEALELLANQEE